MATRWTVGKVQEDGVTVRSVYGHWDGYPDGAGAILAEHYTDASKLDRLLDIGDISSLREDIGEQHDFDSASDVTTFYGRDRGETGIEALVHANVEEWLAFRKGSWCEYGYLWDGSEWKTFKITGEN
jgi:hypothetical protein